jgi:hypothetical protein
MIYFCSVLSPSSNFTFGPNQINTQSHKFMRPRSINLKRRHSPTLQCAFSGFAPWYTRRLIQMPPSAGNKYLSRTHIHMHALTALLMNVHASLSGCELPPLIGVFIYLALVEKGALTHISIRPKEQSRLMNGPSSGTPHAWKIYLPPHSGIGGKLALTSYFD